MDGMSAVSIQTCSDVVVFLGRVRSGWRLQDSITTRLEKMGLISRGKNRSWLTNTGRALLAEHPSSRSLDGVLESASVDVDTIPEAFRAAR